MSRQPGMITPGMENDVLPNRSCLKFVDPLGFIALGLLQQGEEERGRAVSSPPHLAVRKPPDRRSGQADILRNAALRLVPLAINGTKN